MCLKALKQYILLLAACARPSADWLQASKCCMGGKAQQPIGAAYAAGPLEQASFICAC